jgi:hypothetical protein
MPAERIKIVKVYPVYEAVKSGAEMVKAAANDMYSYVYSFVSNYRANRAEKAKAQQEADADTAQKQAEIDEKQEARTERLSDRSI